MPIEIYAVPRKDAKLQWICPNCQWMHKQGAPWRRARIRCTNCQRSFRVGLRFTVLESQAPFNAMHLEEWDGKVVNRTGLVPYAKPAVARLVGVILWQCPLCLTSNNSSNIDSWVPCKGCLQQFFTAVILYKAPLALSTRCPLDWTIPHAQEN